MEEWKAIPGFDGIYEICADGRVRSLARETSLGRGDFKRQIASKILKESINNGYRVVYVVPPGRKKGRAFYVEAAVAQLFPAKAIAPIDPQTGEEWRDIPGYEGYQASNLGRIRSLDRLVASNHPVNAAKRWTRGVILTPGITGVGYLKVELSANGEIKTMSVHRLVAMAFIPNPLNLPIVHHKNEIKTDNRADNLEWVTAEKNIGDWFDRRRLTVNADTIAMIEQALATGKSHAEILAALPQKRKGRK